MIIGITGGIGSGKSYLAQELAKRGFAVYDCDREAKRIIAEDKAVQAAIIKLLGKEAFIDGKYNTAYVAQRVFTEPQLLKALNTIVHPAVKADISRQSSDVSLLVVESAILFESGLDELCDKIVVVTAPEETRIARTIARDYHNEATPENINKVRARIRAQKEIPASTEVPQGKILTIVNDDTSVLSSIIDRISRFAAG
ncbi:MAG: dephospho-CoA kinase [Paludibacteraceae bacterium]|nr:dephospho-CoA kinase [Paludibacteraceae bacterium]